jgi:hypothetical protein
MFDNLFNCLTFIIASISHQLFTNTQNQINLFYQGHILHKRRAGGPARSFMTLLKVTSYLWFLKVKLNLISLNSYDHAKSDLAFFRIIFYTWEPGLARSQMTLLKVTSDLSGSYFAFLYCTICWYAYIFTQEGCHKILGSQLTKTFPIFTV